MRLKHIFWALMLVLGLLVVPTYLLRLTTLGISGGAAYTFFVIFLWGCVMVGSAVVIGLVKTKKLKGYHSFVPTLLFIANLYFTVFSLSQYLAMDGFGGFSLWNLVFGCLNLTWAIFLVAGVCIRKYV